VDCALQLLAGGVELLLEFGDMQRVAGLLPCNAGFRALGPLTGTAGGIVASVLTLWVSFAPCFVLVFLGAPVVERLRSHAALTGALAAVTASVVGVVSNLAVWFALHVMFQNHRTLKVGLVFAVARQTTRFWSVYQRFAGGGFRACVYAGSAAWAGSVMLRICLGIDMPSFFSVPANSGVVLVR